MADTYTSLHQQLCVIYTGDLETTVEGIFPGQGITMQVTFRWFFLRYRRYINHLLTYVTWDGQRTTDQAWPTWDRQTAGQAHLLQFVETSLLRSKRSWTDAASAHLKLILRYFHAHLHTRFQPYITSTTELLMPAPDNQPSICEPAGVTESWCTCKDFVSSQWMERGRGPVQNSWLAQKYYPPTPPLV